MFPHTSGSKISQRHQFHQLEPRGVRSFDVKGKQIKGEKKATLIPQHYNLTLFISS